MSQIDIWNYSKDPERGVREIEIILDEKIIYRVINILIDN